MSNPQSLYPVTPVNLPAWVTSTSATFKKEVKKVLTAIVLFFMVYLILILFSIALAIACIYVGFFVMTNSGHIIGLVAGLGIMSIGIMVFIFLIKFLFSVKKYDESGTFVITQNEQPELFDFIKQLNADTQTQFPKKIVLSPEVNACVFYNDSFWSMIFPVKKNLQIGLGLVNSLTLSEFKAVMAHEFGHFSQRSMKLGSFVYNVNKAVYNMLYENNDYGDFLQKFGNLHWAIGIFVWVTIQIVKAIQKFLQAMYGLINKNYMGLSRQMEFHADAVAASVSGSNNCIAALRKLEVGEVCYQTVIQKANELLQEKTRLKNIYDNHNQVMEQYAKRNNLSLENHTPVTDEAFFKKFRYHKINIKDQWASHPPREERNTYLQELDVQAVKDVQPAWVLFKNAEGLQQELTASLYNKVPGEAQQQMDAAAFKERYQGEVENFNLPKEYNGYYDDRQMNDMDFEAVYNRPNELAVNTTSFETLFKDEWLSLTKTLTGNEQDVTTLTAIIENKTTIKSFDYDGEKMNKNAAPALLEKLNTEIGQQKVLLQQHEETIVSFFHKVATLHSNEAVVRIKEKYQKHFETSKRTTDFMTVGQRAMNLLAPILSGQKMSIEKAISLAEYLQSESDSLKPIIENFLAHGVYPANTTLKSKAENFVRSEYQYFANPRFIDRELSTLHQLLNETVPLMASFQIKNLKTILEYQLNLYKTVTGVTII